jgi:hypothetical protein
MKKKGFYVILFGWFASVLLLAQQAPHGPRKVLRAQSGATGVSSYEEPLSKKFYKRLIRATKRYKLTTKQQAQVQSILQREQYHNEVVTADKLMSGKDKREEQAGLFEESQRQIGAILNKQQKRKFNKDEKTRAWMDGRIAQSKSWPLLVASSREILGTMRRPIWHV